MKIIFQITKYLCPHELPHLMLYILLLMLVIFSIFDVLTGGYNGLFDKPPKAASLQTPSRSNYLAVHLSIKLILTKPNTISNTTCCISTDTCIQTTTLTTFSSPNTLCQRKLMPPHHPFYHLFHTKLSF